MTQRKSCQDHFQKLIPNRFKNADLIESEKLKKNFVDWGKKWAKTFPGESVFIFGHPGSGKTHFAFALIKEIFKNMPENMGFFPRYFTSPHLDDLLIDASMGKGEGRNYLIDNLSTDDLIFIDDFGRETKSERMCKQYFRFLDARYANELPTIITSNFSVSRLHELIDPAIASRLGEFKQIEFPKIDLRQM